MSSRGLYGVSRSLRVGYRAEHVDLRRLDDPRDVDGGELQSQVSADDARDVEDVLDELRLRSRVPVNRLDRVLGLRRIELLHPEKRRPAQDRVERGAELVAHRREKLVLQALCGLSLETRSASKRTGAIDRLGRQRRARGLIENARSAKKLTEAIRRCQRYRTQRSSPEALGGMAARASSGPSDLPVMWG